MKIEQLQCLFAYLLLLLLLYVSYTSYWCTAVVVVGIIAMLYCIVVIAVLRQTVGPSYVSAQILQPVENLSPSWGQSFWRFDKKIYSGPVVQVRVLDNGEPL